MKIYGIAVNKHVTYGHGDFGEEKQIRQDGAYHCEGEFPPFFRSIESAQAYLDSLDKHKRYNKIIVELELRD